MTPPIINTSGAVPAPHFAHPPYRAELFSRVSGWAGVMNANGVNCLTYPNKPGAVVPRYARSWAIARAWNTAAGVRGGRRG